MNPTTSVPSTRRASISLRWRSVNSMAIGLGSLRCRIRSQCAAHDKSGVSAARDPVPVDISRAGRSLRAIRRHKGWTLERAAAAAGMSRATAGRIEAGKHDSARALTAYARGLGADVHVYVRWNGGDLDRLINR